MSCLICLDVIKPGEASACCFDPRCTFCVNCLKYYLENTFIEKAKMGAIYPKCPGLCGETLSFKELSGYTEEKVTNVWSQKINHSRPVIKKGLLKKQNVNCSYYAGVGTYEFCNKIIKYYAAHTQVHCPGCDQERSIMRGDTVKNFDYSVQQKHSFHGIDFDTMRNTDPYSLLQIIVNINLKNKNILHLYCCDISFCLNCFEYVNDVEPHECKKEEKVNVKHCPKCSTPFIKTTGCTETRCVMCNTTFCSICLNTAFIHEICYDMVFCDYCRTSFRAAINDKNVTCEMCEVTFCKYCGIKECIEDLCSNATLVSCINCRVKSYKINTSRSACESCNVMSCIDCTEQGCDREGCYKYAKRCLCDELVLYNDNSAPIIRCNECLRGYCKLCDNFRCDGKCELKVYCINCGEGIIDNEKSTSYLDALLGNKKKKVKCKKCDISFCKNCTSFDEKHEICTYDRICSLCVYNLKEENDSDKHCDNCLSYPGYYYDAVGGILNLKKFIINGISQSFSEKEIKKQHCHHCHHYEDTTASATGEDYFCKRCWEKTFLQLEYYDMLAILLKSRLSSRLSKRTTTKEH